MSLGVILSAVTAAISALVGLVFFHKNAVRKAENKGRMAEIEKNNQIARAIRLTQETGIKYIAENQIFREQQLKTPVTPADVATEKELKEWLTIPQEDKK